MSLFVRQSMLKKVLYYYILFVLLLFAQGTLAKSFTLVTIYPPDYKFSDCEYILDSVVKQAVAKGLDIKLIKLENDDDSTTKALQLTRMAVKMGADTVIGGGNSEQSVITASILNQAHIPFISAVGVHPDISSGKPYVATILVNAFYLCKVLVDDMIKIVPNPNKIAIFRDLSSLYTTYNGDRVAELLKKRYPAITVYNLDIVDGYENVKSLADQVQTIKPDIIYLPLSHYQNSSFLIELAKKPFNTHIFLNGKALAIHEGEYDHLILKGAPEISFHLVSAWGGSISGPFAEEYNELMRGKLGNDLRTVMTFNAIKLLINNLSQHPNARGITLMKAIKSKEFFGIAGKFWFDKYGNTMMQPEDMLHIIRY